MTLDFGVSLTSVSDARRCTPAAIIIAGTSPVPRLGHLRQPCWRRRRDRMRAVVPTRLIAPSTANIESTRRWRPALPSVKVPADFRYGASSG